MTSLIAKNHPSFIKRTGATYSAAAAVWANTAAKQVGRILREQHSGMVCPWCWPDVWHPSQKGFWKAGCSKFTVILLSPSSLSKIVGFESKSLNPPFHLQLDEGREKTFDIWRSLCHQISIWIWECKWIMNHFTIDTFHGIFQIVTKQQQRSVNGWNLPNLGACWNQESSPQIEWAIVVASHFLSVTWIAVEEIKTIWWIDIIMSSLTESDASHLLGVCPS